MIFLDACAIIYWIEAGEPQYTKFVKKLRAIHSQHGNLPFAISQLSLLECCVKPLRDKNSEALQAYQRFFNAKNLVQISLTTKIINTATKLRADYHLATPDALQAASALSLSETSFFLTADKTFKKIPDLTVILL